MPYLYNKPYDEKWRKNNKQKYNEYQRAFMRQKYHFQKARMEFLAILLE
jgi:chromosome segregation and condensation protein ScpB